ncbi:MAG TPA: type II CAAX endopeptidase family protein [Mucilaginibacter sp.]|nr:type II CAAX endopeptidase family protein [Mucilaginibacter sp.]
MMRGLKSSRPLGTFFRALLFYLSATLIFIGVGSSGIESGNIDTTFVKMAIAALLTFVLSLIFVRLEGITLAGIGLSFSGHTLQRFLGGSAIGLLMASLQPVVLLIHGHFHLECVHPSFGIIVFNLLFYLAAACREEITFRGYPFRRLDERFGPWIAQGIMFVLFALEHKAGGMSWITSFIGAGTGALLFGVAALKSRGLALPVGLHFAWNVGQWLWGFKNSPGFWQATVENGYAAQEEKVGYAVYLLAAGLAAIGICLYYRNRVNRAVN